MRSLQEDRDAVLHCVQSIVSETLRGLPVRVFLFGSWAKMAEHPTSDIDVAVEPLGALPMGTLPLLRERLEDAPILRTVDLVDLSTSDPAFRQKVYEEGIRWID